MVIVTIVIKITAPGGRSLIHYHLHHDNHDQHDDRDEDRRRSGAPGSEILRRRPRSTRG
jgi:hypothetical protein